MIKVYAKQRSPPTSQVAYEGRRHEIAEELQDSHQKYSLLIRLYDPLLMIRTLLGMNPETETADHTEKLI